jgi:hypothetical protein
MLVRFLELLLLPFWLLMRCVEELSGEGRWYRQQLPNAVRSSEPEPEPQEQQPQERTAEAEKKTRGRPRRMPAVRLG